MQGVEDTELVLSGSIHHAVMQPLKAYLGTILNDFDFDNDVLMDCSNLRYIDSAFIASLLLFQSELKTQNRELSFQNVPDVLN